MQIEKMVNDVKDSRIWSFFLAILKEKKAGENNGNRYTFF